MSENQRDAWELCGLPVPTAEWERARRADEELRAWNLWEFELIVDNDEPAYNDKWRALRRQGKRLDAGKPIQFERVRAAARSLFPYVYRMDKQLRSRKIAWDEVAQGWIDELLEDREWKEANPEYRDKPEVAG
jgi:hypothetical protein